MHRVLVLLLVAVTTAPSSRALAGMSSPQPTASSAPSLCLTPSMQRAHRPPRQADSVSPSLSSLASIRAQLQQLNQRIKREPATAPPVQPSPIGPLTPATPQSALSSLHDSFSSPVGSMDTTLPPTSSSPLSEPAACGLTSSRLSSARSQSSRVSTSPTEVRQSNKADRHSGSSDCHDIYQLASPSHSPALALPLSPLAPLSSPSTAQSHSPLRWRREAAEAQRTARALSSQVCALQAALGEERRRRARLESSSAEEQRARVERERALAELRRDVDGMRAAMSGGRQRLEAELRAEYEEVLAAQLREKDELEEAGQQTRLALEKQSSGLQQRVQQLSEQLRSSELSLQHSSARAREAEDASRQLDVGQQQRLADQHAELVQRVEGAVLPLLPQLSLQYQQRMADTEQRLVRLHTAVQLVSGRVQAKQQLIQRLTQQHEDDTALLQRSIAGLTQQSSHHQQHMQGLAAEHDAYCATLRGQLDEERARAHRLEEELAQERAARRSEAEAWARMEAELRRDRSELSAYYHNELDGLMGEMEQLENDKEEMAARLTQLALDAQPAAAAAQDDEQSANEWQQRATDVAARLASMQDEVRCMRDEITGSAQRELDMRRAVANIRREAQDRDEDKERQLDDMRGLLQQLRQAYYQAAAERRQHGTSKAGLLDESKESAADEQCELNESCTELSSEIEQAESGGETAGGLVQRLLSENQAMKSEVARERQKFSQLLKVRQFVHQHSSPRKHAAAGDEKSTTLLLKQP